MEKPILFNTEMVKAILEGRKTVTRRVVPEKILDKYYSYDDFCISVGTGDIPTTREYEEEFFMKRASYRVGDILYVRETYLKADDGFSYRADETPTSRELRESYGYKWKPSIHMPKEAARIFLKVTDVRVERLKDITDDGILKEGVIVDPNPSGYERNNYRFNFSQLWGSVYGNWDVNPWVWVIEFEKIY